MPLPSTFDPSFYVGTPNIQSRVEGEPARPGRVLTLLLILGGLAASGLATWPGYGLRSPENAPAIFRIRLSVEGIHRGYAGGRVHPQRFARRAEFNCSAGVAALNRNERQIIAAADSQASPVTCRILRAL